MKARHEYKHSLGYVDYTILRSRLRAVLPRDSNANGDGSYTVRSLYFDTPSDTALREKIDGVSHREKFRLRRYNNDTTTIHLEKKSKHHGLCYKTTEAVTAAEAEALLNGDINWLLNPQRPLCAELYSKMKGSLLQPKALVTYTREPYIFTAGNVRITFDTNIQTGLHATDFLSNAQPFVPAGDELVLLEVKYDEFIPGFIADILQLGQRRASACSKYALCRMYG